MCFYNLSVMLRELHFDVKIVLQFYLGMHIHQSNIMGYVYILLSQSSNENNEIDILNMLSYFGQ